ncbi:MAG: hypothetical protein HYR74_05440 [Candidatus Eisenbacteria bacterium]|nr:hypothetical protein [Candidatus Eisenbacteria bacterium]
MSDDPMPDDFPWNGTVSLPGQLVHGGETEDYPVTIQIADHARPSNWGRLKLLYRPVS